MTNASFNLMANQVLDIMAELAEQEGATGVGFLASLEDSDNNNWECRMKVCGALTHQSTESKCENLAAIAFSKMAEMMDTKRDSGTKPRPALSGELALRGGAILSDGFGYIAASFAGGTPEIDYLISLRCIKFLQTII